MNYRHAFHAGNFADVIKHAVLARILVYLREKNAAFREQFEKEEGKEAAEKLIATAPNARLRARQYRQRLNKEFAGVFPDLSVGKPIPELTRLLETEGVERQLPVALDRLRLVRQQRQRVLHVEHAREVLRALGVPAEPVDVIGRAAQHVMPRAPRCPSSRRPARS